ncbi:MAG: extensin family protein [Rhodospirillales bacterium]
MSGFNVLFVAVALSVAGLGLLRQLPPQQSPLAPLSLADPIGWTTAGKLRQLAGETEPCHLLLTRSSVSFRPVPNRSEGDFCGYAGAVALPGEPAVYAGGPVQVSCPLAAALTLWQRDVVGPAAKRHLGNGVRRIEHAGSYACRRVYGSKMGAVSQHASANAIDITGFRLADGRVISVANDWSGTDESRRAFLRDVRDGGCRLFSGVLGPDYNVEHRDHFHLDMGLYRVCR